MNNGNALISIIIPVYNVKSYVEICIESVLAQTYKHLQIILIDDGSVDGSGEICDSYSSVDSRITVVHTVNSGLSAARNEGMKFVKGDYVIFIDSDDYIGLSHIQNLFNALMSTDNPDGSIAVTGCTVVSESSSSAIDDRSSCMPLYKYMSTAEAISTSFAWGAWRQSEFGQHAWGKIYPKSLFEVLIYPVGKHYEDQFVTYKAFLQAHTIVYENADDYYYRESRSGSITAGNRINRIDQFEAASEMLPIVQEYCPEAGVSALMRYQANLISAIDNASIMRCISNYQELYKLGFCMRSSVISNRLLPKAIRFRYRTLILNKSRSIVLGLLGLLLEYPPERLRLALNKRIAAIANQKKLIRQYSKIRGAYSKSTAFLIMTPGYINYGDQLIAFSELSLLKRAGFEKVIEIPVDRCFDLGAHFADLLKPGDCVFVTGGGYLGELWPTLESVLLKTVSKIGTLNPLIFFPQSVFYDQNRVEKSHLATSLSKCKASIVFLARERYTYDTMAKLPINVGLLQYPDVGLLVRRSMLMDEAPQRVQGLALVCIRKDKEAQTDNAFGANLTNALFSNGMTIRSIDTHLPKGEIDPEKRKSALSVIAREFGRASLVVTDRLHGMIFAMIMSTPCIVIDNVSKKVSGVASWVHEKYPVISTNDTGIKEAVAEAVKLEPFKGDVAELLGNDEQVLLAFLEAVSCLG